MRVLPKSIWPYFILERGDAELKADLKRIIDHFDGKFDVVVFIPNAGLYLCKLLEEMSEKSYKTGYITIRRALSTSRPNQVKNYIFRRRWLANIVRHIEVFLRLIKTFLMVKRRRVINEFIDFDVDGKRTLIIDDSVDTGTTIRLAKQILLEHGAESVMTSCISNHLLPSRVQVDFSVYQFALLRTKNSKDYAAK